MIAGSGAERCARRPERQGLAMFPLSSTAAAGRTGRTAASTVAAAAASARAELHLAPSFSVLTHPRPPLSGQEAQLVRLTLGLSASSVASSLGIPHSTLQRWVRSAADRGPVPCQCPAPL